MPQDERVEHIAFEISKVILGNPNCFMSGETAETLSAKIKAVINTTREVINGIVPETIAGTSTPKVAQRPRPPI